MKHNDIQTLSMALDFSKLQSIFFDLDNTLIDHTAAERKAFIAAYDHFEFEHGTLTLTQLLEHYQVINEHLWSEYRHGRITTADVRLQRWQKILDLQFEGQSDDVQHTADEVSAYYLAEYDNSSELMPGAADLLALCKQRFSFVGLITNGFPDQVRRKLTNHQWLDTFHVVVISEVVGIAKPHEGIFLHAASQLAHPVSQTAYVGDNYEIDIIGAKNASWNTVWLRLPGHERSEQNHADLVVDSLHEVNRMLD